MVVGLVAVVLRAAPVVRDLRAIFGYDDGVYYASAVAFTNGLVPYRDFILLQPPGMTLLLAPFAMVGGVLGDDIGFALARAAAILGGTACALLVSVIAGRWNARAGAVAGLVYATWPTAASVERSTDLHVPESLLVIAALLILTGRSRIDLGRAALTGAVLGLATSVHLWHGLTVAVAMWWILIRARGGGLDRLRVPLVCGASAVGVFAAICLPFFLAAPAQIVDQALIDQLARPDMSVGTVDRLRVLVGLAYVRDTPVFARLIVEAPVIVAMVALAVAIVLRTAATRRWARPWIVLGGAQLLLLMSSPSFYVDYPSLVAPAGTLVLGTGAADLLGASRDRRPRQAGAVVLATVLVAFGVVSVLRYRTTSFALDALRVEAARAACVSSDHPSLLVLTNAARHDIALGCPLVIDPTGVRYDTDRGRLQAGDVARSMRAATGYQAAMLAWYSNSSLAFFVRGTQGLSPDTLRAVAERLPIVRRLGVVTIRQRAPGIEAAP